MKNTENYGLGKPELTEFYDVGVQNDNMDIIDAELKKHDDSISNLVAAQGNTGTEISEINTRIDEVQETVATAQSTADTATNIAKGRNQAISYASYQELVEKLNAMEVDELRTGQNLYVGAMGVPDLWVYGVVATKSEYTYVSDDAIVSEIEANVYIQIGYYLVNFLETQKVDLTNIEAEIEENAKSIANILSALKSAGINENILSANMIPANLTFANLIARQTVTFFTVTKDSNFPENYGSGVLIPMADTRVKYICYIGNSFHVAKVDSGVVTWSEQSQKSALDAFITQINRDYYGTDGWNGPALFDLMPNDDPSAQLSTLGMCYLSNEEQIAQYNGPSDAHNCYVYAFGMNTYRYAMLAIERGTNRMWVRTDTAGWTRLFKNSVHMDSFIWAKTLTITFDSVGDSSVQIFTQEGILALDYANGAFRTRSGSTLLKKVNYELKDDVLTITESEYGVTQTLNGNVLTITFDSSWACGIIMASRPFTLATSQ